MELVHSSIVKVQSVAPATHILTFTVACSLCRTEFRFQVKPDIPVFENLKIEASLQLDVFLRKKNSLLYHHRFPYAPTDSLLKDAQAIVFGNFVENDLSLKMKRVGVYGDRIIISAPYAWVQEMPLSVRNHTPSPTCTCWKHPDISPAKFFNSSQLMDTFVFSFTKVV